MRLYERTLVRLEIAPHAEQTDALGGVRLSFSPRRIPVRGSLQPDTNTLNHAASTLNFEAQGLRAAQTMRALLPRDAEIAPGDGVCTDGAAQPQWLVLSVEDWTAHKLARLARRL